VSLITVTRWGSTPMGTFGRMAYAGWECFTLERPWAQNKPSVSCIPAGLYPLRLGMFYGGDGPGGKPDYPAYEVLNVPDRQWIKIHIANLALQVNGCIAVGKSLGAERGIWAVQDSHKAYDELMALPDALEISINWAAAEW
jgi:hypothetical protein